MNLQAWLGLLPNGFLDFIIQQILGPMVVGFLGFILGQWKLVETYFKTRAVRRTFGKTVKRASDIRIVMPAFRFELPPDTKINYVKNGPDGFRSQRPYSSATENVNAFEALATVQFTNLLDSILPGSMEVRTDAERASNNSKVVISFGSPVSNVEAFLFWIMYRQTGKTIDHAVYDVIFDGDEHRMESLRWRSYRLTDVKTGEIFAPTDNDEPILISRVDLKGLGLPERYVFLVFGMTDVGTFAGAHFFAQNWKKIGIDEGPAGVILCMTHKDSRSARVIAASNCKGL